MTITTKAALAVNFREYCLTLVKVQEECKDTLLGMEKETIREHIEAIQTKGLGYREGANPGFGNMMYLRLKPGTTLADPELDVDGIHRNFSEITFSGIINSLSGAIQTLLGYYSPEPEVFVLKPYEDHPTCRYLTTEWINWFKRRHPEQNSIRQIAITGGQRIHELMVKDGTSPLAVGDTLKVTVNLSSSEWDGKDVPVSLWNMSPKEF